jgi:hypothetical protein
LKETPQASLVQKKPAPDKVENLAKEYLAELREVDVTFEKGTAVLEKYRAKYPELASYIREIVPGERRIEIRQRLEGEDKLPCFLRFVSAASRRRFIQQQHMALSSAFRRSNALVGSM